MAAYLQTLSINILQNFRYCVGKVYLSSEYVKELIKAFFLVIHTPGGKNNFKLATLRFLIEG